MFGMVLSTLLSLAASTAAAGVPVSNGANQTSILYNVSNATRLGAIDPRFTCDFQQGRASLSASSSLMSAANAMMDLALENFTEPIRPRTFVDPNFPEVLVVASTPGRDQRVEARYLLWGVWEGIRRMISHRSFRDLVVSAYWDGSPVCLIWIRGAYGELGAGRWNNSLDLAARSREASNHNATVDIRRSLGVGGVLHPLSDRHLTVTVTRVGVSLGITKVFNTVFATLEYMAHFPSSDEVASFHVSPDDGETTFAIQEHPRGPGVRAPVLEYQWAILSVGQIAGYMLLESSFTEVNIEIAVDGILLGTGSLSEQRLQWR